MPDQANSLRRLMRASTAGEGLRPALRPRVALVIGGRRGVGTTTMALNLAVAMAQRGVRAVLVDVDSRGGDLAAWCRLEGAHSLADVLAGRCTVTEALQPGPGGIHVLGGIWALESVSDHPPSAWASIVEQFANLIDLADWVLIDAGHGAAAAAERMRSAADLVLWITTADDDAVMDTYAAIKTLGARKPLVPLATLVNAVPRGADGDDVQGRLARACRRFLGFEPCALGSIVADTEVRRAAASGDPFVLTVPTSTVARQVYRAAKNLCSLPNLRRRAG